MTAIAADEPDYGIPPAHTHVAETFNERGTPVSMFQCLGCRTVFTVCPAVPEEKWGQWTGCMATDCTTYDEARDGDKLFDEGKVYRVGDRSHLAIAAPSRDGEELSCDFAKGLPGGTMDDTTYEQIEAALDRLDAPMTRDGRWLTLAERVAALAPSPGEGDAPGAWRVVSPSGEEHGLFYHHGEAKANAQPGDTVKPLYGHPTPATPAGEDLRDWRSEFVQAARALENVLAGRPVRNADEIISLAALQPQAEGE